MSVSYPSYALLVGSIPLDSTEQVLESVSHTVASVLHYVPDGETGERKSFVQWQQVHIPSVVRRPMFGGTPDPSYPPVELTLQDIKPVRYDDFAIASYRHFLHLRDQGRFKPGTRFQVCLPTPMSVVRALVETPYCAQVQPLYEARLLQALQRIQQEIPCKDLTIQWDMPIEMAMMEYARGKLTESFFVDFFRPYFDNVHESIFAQFKRLATAVNPEAAMGYHMCYGNFKQKHWLEPEDTSLLVDVANRLTEDISPIRSIEYFHMPVPKDREDTAYLEPLQKLAADNSSLVLGLVHGFDLEGTKRRIATAQKVWKRPFGIATECGMTGKPLEYLNSVLEISASLVQKVQ